MLHMQGTCSLCTVLIGSDAVPDHHEIHSSILSFSRTHSAAPHATVHIKPYADHRVRPDKGGQKTHEASFKEDVIREAPLCMQEARIAERQHENYSIHHTSRAEAEAETCTVHFGAYINSFISFR